MRSDKNQLAKSNQAARWKESDSTASRDTGDHHRHTPSFRIQFVRISRMGQALRCISISRHSNCWYVEMLDKKNAMQALPACFRIDQADVSSSKFRCRHEEMCPFISIDPSRIGLNAQI
jgi:hypothetical protein